MTPRTVREVVAELDTMTRYSGAGYEENVDTFLWKGVRLLKVVVSPINERRETSLVICHSLFEFSKLQRSEITLARTAAAAGFRSIYVQAPGAGDSEGSPTQSKVMDRVELAVDMAGLLSHGSGREGTICFMGARLGGAVAARAAADHEGPVASIVWDPSLEKARYWDQLKRIDRITAVSGGYRSRDPEVLLKEGHQIALFGVKVDLDVTDDLAVLDDLVSGRSIDGPVLGVLAGSSPPQPGLAALSSDLEIVRTGSPRAPHLGVREAREAVEPTVEWMRRKLP